MREALGTPLGGTTMATVTPPASTAPAPAASAAAAEVYGFDLVLDALKLNGVDTIFGLPGLPIADHPGKGESRGPAGDLVPPRAERGLCGLDRRVHHAEAGHLPHGVRARLPERPHGSRQRDHQLLPHDPHLRLVGARDRRPAAGRLRGDGP